MKINSKCMLIDLNDFMQEDESREAMAENVNTADDIVIGNLNTYIFPKLKKNCSFQFVSNGHWSMHQLLQTILSITGQANVFISSYAFSEQPARLIAQLKSESAIKELNCIIDSRVDVRSAGALQLLKNTADRLKLCATHAKVTIVVNDDWHFSIIGSANYTTNKRYESGVIIENKSLSTKNIGWIMNEINNND